MATILLQHATALLLGMPAKGDKAMDPAQVHRERFCDKYLDKLGQGACAPAIEGLSPTNQPAQLSVPAAPTVAP